MHLVGSRGGGGARAPPEVGECAAARILHHPVQELLAQSHHILRPVQDYLDFNEVEIQRISEENRQLADRMALGLLLLGVCGPLGGLFVYLGIRVAMLEAR